VRGFALRNYSGALIAVVIMIGTLVMVPAGPEESTPRAKTISVGEQIRPYSTEVNETGVVEFKNTLDTSLNVSFESDIGNFTIEPRSSSEVYLSKYDDLPSVNYFSAGEAGGRLVLSED
jgi:hypothetical protein